MPKGGNPDFGVHCPKRPVQPQREAPAQLPPPPPPPHRPVQVGDAAVTLGGPVELADLGDAEAAAELLPDGGSQAVAHRQPHAVPAFGLTHRLRQEVPADFPDILNNLERQTQKEGSGGRRDPRQSRRHPGPWGKQGGSVSGEGLGGFASGSGGFVSRFGGFSLGVWRVHGRVWRVLVGGLP